jgi:acetyl-CoA carboxylase biotin carboxyl carrier protein
MFKLSEIKELIKLIDQSTLQELEIQNEGYKLCIRKAHKPEAVYITSSPAQPAYAPPAVYSTPQLVDPTTGVPNNGSVPAVSVPVASTTHLHTIVSPMVGTYYHASSPEAEAFVQVGDQVKEKTIVCIVEAMKLMNEIEAEIKGEIVQILVENGQLVEYGQPLYLVKPE